MPTPTYSNLSKASFTAGTNQTVAHTPSGVDRIVFAWLMIENTITNLSVTYGGNAMTLVDSITTTNAAVHLYKYVNPPLTSQNCAATWTGNATGWLQVISYSNVNQFIPLGTTSKASSNSSTTPSVTVTSAVGELVIDGVSAHVAFTATGAGQTVKITEATVVNVRGSEEAGAASVVMDWTLGSASNWASIGVSLKPSPGGGNILMNYL